MTKAALNIELAGLRWLILMDRGEMDGPELTDELLRRCYDFLVHRIPLEDSTDVILTKCMEVLAMIWEGDKYTQMYDLITRHIEAEQVTVQQAREFEAKVKEQDVPLFRKWMKEHFCVTSDMPDHLLFDFIISMFKAAMTEPSIQERSGDDQKDSLVRTMYKLRPLLRRHQLDTFEKLQDYWRNYGSKEMWGKHGAPSLSWMIDYAKKDKNTSPGFVRLLKDLRKLSNNG